MKESTVSAQHYLDELKDLDLSLPPQILSRYSDIVGSDVAQPATREQIDRAQRWIHSSQKRLFEISLCHLIGFLGGRAICQLEEDAIQRIDGKKGTISIQVGFLGSQGPLLREHRKVRTMVPGAHQSLESPFQHTSFIGARGKKDTRILPSRLAKILRRTALDELPQICYQVPQGALVVVGARGYSQQELEGTRILIDLAHEPALQLSPVAKDLLDSYTRKVDEYKPVSSLTSLYQAVAVKNTPHLARMFADVVYWERTKPVVDLRIIYYSARQRIRGVGSW